MKRKFFFTFLISLIVFSAIFIGMAKVLEPDETFNPEDLGKDNEIEPVVDNEILFLLLGVDAEDNLTAKGTRTDTIMLVKLNFDTGKMSLLSIPRDTRVMVRGKPDKINHAHAYGGTSLTLRAVRDFLNIDLDYYVKADYRAVKGVVDAIGGVDIDVPMTITIPDSTVKLQPGLQNLKGDEAIAFLRFRSGYANADLGRIEAQQYFMKELAKQTLKASNITKLPQIAKSYFSYVDTNIPMTTILKGLTYANKMDSNLETMTVPGSPQTIDGVSYVVYDEMGIREIVDNMFSDYKLD